MTESTPQPPAAIISAPRTWLRREPMIVARDALLIAGVATLLALGFNAVRADGIPLVARQEFEILVPCPEPIGTATSIASGDERIRGPDSLLIDARSAEEYARWHLPEALNTPFDWLAEQAEVDQQAAEIARTVARSGRRHVIVYGDGGDPDSGHHWAILLHGAGIKNVVFVSGGAPALRNPSATRGGAP